ncbi:Uncharacterized protein, contains FMN-binding domain [Peptoclostridium litorale DSM 5388]|uniref:FMN-binding domain protein n=1 Tax=Peptoclostridium litorale DSM 5388 TaxID=1121324 RepID=A0A069RCP5_PEPLI|nr:4Fe-4S binding protein [Peptoclostridium litorale]KDR94533.1 FMN-binding domain protein [Peptoclostridium litorale DSM 5388]SIO37193.1 Uncharacterized protein, contains FMN-binding domain [Peptoclostridium litorale DSM 5388]
MKKIQFFRSGTQILFTSLIAASFLTDLRAFMLIVLLITIFCGPFYCGWICPYGFLQDILGKVAHLLGIKKRRMPLQIQKVIVFSRYAVLALILFSVSDAVFNLMSFDPRANFTRILGREAVSFAALGVIIFFLAVSLVFERPFCNCLCYEGAKHGLLGSLRIFTLKRYESVCINCRKCDDICPMNISVSKIKNLRSPQCINCFECVSSCPVSGALCFGKADMDESGKKRFVASALAALVLVGSFMGYSLFARRDDTASQPPPNVQAVYQNEPSAVAGIADGVYTGEGEGFNGKIVVEVTVSGQNITGVEVVSTRDDYKWFERANSKIPGLIIDSQSADVDIVSGSTYSSIGILDAVKDALQKAKH